MSQTLLEMTKELVLAQIHIQEVTPEAMEGVLHSTYETLRRLQTMESAGGIGSSEGALERLESKARVDWKGSITKHSVRCLECGETFKQLSLRSSAKVALLPYFAGIRQVAGFPPTLLLDSGVVGLTMS